MKKFIALAILSFGIQSSFAQFISNTGIQISNSSLLVTNGEWTNSGGILLNDGTLTTTSSFVNHGTLDPQSTGGFVLDFATDLNFRPGGSRMGFLTKNGAGKALVTGSIGLKDSLVLRKGVITLLSTTDTVSLSAGAQLVARDTFFIEGGFVALGGTGDVLFPIGKDGLYLPIKIHKLNAQRVTVSLERAGSNHTAGPGVDALINFPYSWRVSKQVATDTAGYIELNFPSVMNSVSNPIVIREIPGLQYASMGARLISDTGTRTMVKSYSRRLQGLFTVGQGFPSDPVTDSLALVALYQSSGGPQWTNNANWLTGTIDTWFGVTINGQSITSVELPANNLKGPIADPLVDILSLQTINLSVNDVTSIPDFSLNPEITSLNVSDNNLDFSSLEPNASVPGINYMVQSEIGTPVDLDIPVGSSYNFMIPAQGSNSVYKWRRNGVEVAGAEAATYTLPAIGRETMGEYVAEVTNPGLPGLILKSSRQKVMAHAHVSGKLFADINTPATQGELTLYRIQPGAFEAISSSTVANDGSYTFGEVILDDYQIRGFADTVLYERALPTYYKNTIFWEEADTLVLTNNINDLDIISELEPGPPSGRGSISGYLQEDDGAGRVHDTERSKRIARAGVSARRVERTGRTKEEILTLVAYVFTDENGEFNLPNLPTGEYRINFQYPGYPMDETSYTTIKIGTALESQVMVEANVQGGKINVRKLIITGIAEGGNYHAEVFPNPAVEDVHMKFAGEVQSRLIKLTDLQGKVLHTLDASGKEVTVNVGHLPKGMYILQVSENGKKVKTLKLSIE